VGMRVGEGGGGETESDTQTIAVQISRQARGIRIHNNDHNNHNDLYKNNSSVTSSLP